MSIVSDLSRIKTAKSDIANAIAGKGVEVPEGTKIDGYASLIEWISTKAEVGYLHADRKVDFVDLCNEFYPFGSDETVIGAESYKDKGIVATVDSNYLLKIYQYSTATQWTVLNQCTVDSNFSVSNIGFFIYADIVVIIGSNKMVCKYDLVNNTWTEPTQTDNAIYTGSNITIFGTVYGARGNYTCVDKIYAGGKFGTTSIAVTDETYKVMVRNLFKIKDNLYVLGSVLGGSYSNNVYKYNPELSTWEKKYSSGWQNYNTRNIHIVVDNKAYAFYAYNGNLNVYKFGKNSKEVCTYKFSSLAANEEAISFKVDNTIHLFFPETKEYVTIDEKEQTSIGLTTGTIAYSNGNALNTGYTRDGNVLTVTKDTEFKFIDNTYLTIIKDNTICYMQLTENSSGIYGYFLAGMVVNGIEVTTSGAQTIATTLPVTVTYETA